MKQSVIALLIALWVSAAVAEEGMWTLDNFPKAALKATYGVKITDDWLAKVQRATTRLGGCTGSFVSPDGLILTNNHCVWSCVRDLSSDGRNLSEEGFFTTDRSEERRCEGQEVSVLVATQEITEEVAQATRGKGEVEANEARQATLSQLELTCEQEAKEELSCQAVTLYNGGQYFLYKYKRYNDVRLVFAPELPIAAFGGDPDNFDFPRYCLDMSFLRVYEDGEPARTPDYLSLRPEGPAPGEAVFVVGHPGSTQRLLTTAGLEQVRRFLPLSLLLTSELRGRLIEWGQTGEEAARVVQQRLLGLENGLKINRNRILALMDDELMARKREEERVLRQAVAADPELHKAYGSAWDEVERAVDTFQTFAEEFRFIESGSAFNTTLFAYARGLVRAAVEREKPNAERLREYRETALAGLERRILARRPLQLEYEKLTLAFSLEKMLEWLGPDDPFVHKVLGKTAPRELANELISESKLADPDERKRLWQGGVKAIQASEDPMIRLVLKIDEDARALRRRMEEEVQAPRRQGSEKIARARFAIKGTSVYPDATFTLRVTYGSVKGWEEKGSTIAPFTTLDVLYQRATGADPFRIPRSWLDARDRLDPKTRFNFVANTDIVGGNSGSPIVDGSGRLVGLAFDGNLHSTAGAYWFDEARNRTIAVHPAIMVEALRKVYRAKSLLAELGLSRH